MSTSGSKSNEHVAHFLVDIHKKKEVYHVKLLTEGKKNIISALIDEYDIETAEGHSGCPSGFAGRHH